MRFDFCPSCGNQTVHRHDATHYTCTACGQELYNNPKTTVAVIFLRGDQALFSKRGIAPNKGKYDFPGGFIEYAEDPIVACIREIAEETSVAIQASDLHLLTAYSSEYLPLISVTDLLYVCTTWKGEFIAADDSAALEWKPLSFIDDPAFAPDFLGLTTKLRDFI